MKRTPRPSSEDLPRLSNPGRQAAPAGGERGVALLVVMIVSVMLALLGLTMTFDSMSEISISNDLEARQKALAIADAGFNAAKGILKGKDLSQVLANYYTGGNATADLDQPVTINQYISYSVPTGTVELSYFSRNPLAPLEAVNVNFADLPGAVGSRCITGFLTPVEGVAIGGGRYWAKLTDNADGDGIDEDGDTDLFDDDEDGVDADCDGIDDVNGDTMDSAEDTDGIVYLRVMGIQPLGAGQVATYGTTVKNSVAILEAKLERDISFNLSAPFSLYGTNVGAAQGGSFFNGGVATLDGYDHPGYTLVDLVGGKALGKGHVERQHGRDRRHGGRCGRKRRPGHPGPYLRRDPAGQLRRRPGRQDRLPGALPGRPCQLQRGL